MGGLINGGGGLYSGGGGLYSEVYGICKNMSNWFGKYTCTIDNYTMPNMYICRL
jgi:hypothetical protein